ncbi:MAG: class I poly(R)-hydroxyalkanoic acid synthase [Gammaproteobacteria bacterium]
MLESLKLENIRSQYEMSRLMAGMSKDLGKAYAQWFGRLLINPSTPLRGSANLAMDWLSISRDAALKMAGVETAGEKLNGDRRFRSDAWQKNPTLDLVRRLYMAYARTVLEMVDRTRGMDEEQRRKVRFFTAQFLDAIAPSNFPLTNPEVIEATVGSKGGNLASGLMNLWEDLDLRHGRLNISMSDLGAFEVGRDLAVTPGEVVYQNELIQLIQYTPTTKQVAKRPLLIIPPWLNKFYVLDMQPDNSVVKYLVDQGQTVFLISWRNPDESTPDKSFDDYMLEGPLQALEVIEAITGEAEVNAMGYCLGGILLACTLAWLDAKGRNPIRSGTYLTTLIDYSDVGDVKVFVDEAQIKRLERVGKRKGYIPGDNVAWGFRMLRAPDLIWSFIINHYLLGKERMPFDLLFWNEDATNMPLTAHSYFMRNMYMHNRLREPGGIEMAGEPIDVTRIKTPAYVLSTRDDHIAPWKTTYESTQLFSGPTRFVLGNSGHIAGVINPPSKKKYGYRASSETPADADAWLHDTEEHAGSWWPDWIRWLRRYSDGKVAARKPGSDEYPSLEPAPGSFVKQTIRPPK